MTSVSVPSIPQPAPPAKLAAWSALPFRIVSATEPRCCEVRSVPLGSRQMSITAAEKNVTQTVGRIANPSYKVVASGKHVLRRSNTEALAVAFRPSEVQLHIS